MASQLSGLRSATIRAWEKRYQVVTPERADNKHRLYSELDIEKLSLLAQLTELGQNIGKIAKLDLEELKRVYETVMKKPYVQKDFSKNSRDKLNFDKTLANLTLAISNFKPEIIFHELIKIKNVLTISEIALQTLPLLYEIIDKKLLKGDITPGEANILEHIIYLQFSTLYGQEEPQSLDNALAISSLQTHSSTRNLLLTELLITGQNVSHLYLGRLSPKELARTMSKLKLSTLVLLVNGYQIDDIYNLDQYLDELVRYLGFTPQMVISGSMETKDKLTRKNCHFVTSPKDLNLYLEYRDKK